MPAAPSPTLPRFRGTVAAPLALLASCSGAGAGRDVVSASRDVVVEGTPDASTPAGYEYVARRALAVVGLAEARGLDPRLARAAVDRLADALDACMAGERRKGEPGQGAARVVAQIEPGGAVGGTTLRADPGEDVAREAALCLVAPVRLLNFPPADSGSRGLAVEALWGRPR